MRTDTEGRASAEATRITRETHASPADGGTIGAEGVGVAVMVQRISAHLAEAHRASTIARFAIGDEIHLIRQSGDAASLRRVAALVGLDPSGLQRTSRIAERIRGAERRTLLALVDRRGLPLRWSHFDQLERVRGAEARLALAHAALEENLCVLELRSRVRTSKK
jgi:hypothetical protein